MQPAGRFTAIWPDALRAGGTEATDSSSERFLSGGARTDSGALLMRNRVATAGRSCSESRRHTTTGQHAQCNSEPRGPEKSRGDSVI